MLHGQVPADSAFAETALDIAPGRDRQMDPADPVVGQLVETGVPAHYVRGGGCSHRADSFGLIHVADHG